MEMYRDHPCLWQVTRFDYHHKNKRNQALEEIAILFKTVDPTANKETVLKKTNSMRGSFKKEINKVKQSQKSDAAAHEVHVPKLWYFDHLMFLEDKDTNRPTIDIRSVNPFEAEDSELEVEEVMTATPSTSRVPPQTPTLSKVPSFKRPKSKADQLLDNISKKLDLGRPHKEVQKSSYRLPGRHARGSGSYL